jgi:hypothetical protein
MATTSNTLTRFKAIAQTETLTVATLKRLLDVAVARGGDSWMQTALDGAGITLVQWQAVSAAVTAIYNSLEATSGADRKALEVFNSGSSPTMLLSQVRDNVRVLGKNQRDSNQLIADALLMATALGFASAGDWLNDTLIADGKTKAQFNAARTAMANLKLLLAANTDTHSKAMLLVEGEG